jgi:hypothetical protein
LDRAQVEIGTSFSKSQSRDSENYYLVASHFDRAIVNKLKGKVSAFVRKEQLEWPVIVAIFVTGRSPIAKIRA